jgi:hypothetical protein
VLAGALLGPLAAGLAPAGAQPVLGAGDDATLPAPGQLRVRVLPGFNSAATRAGGPAGTGGGRAPIGGEFSTDAFGPAQLPGLAAPRDTLRAVTGRSDLALSLGSVQVRGRTSTQTVPTLIEYGVTRRLALAVTLPFARVRWYLDADVNAGGGSGNFGLNPVRDATAGQAALQQNARALQNLDNAITLLRAQGAAAAGLVAEAQRFRNGIAAVYGAGGAQSPGAVAVPLAGSDAQAAVAQRLAALSGQFAERGVRLDPAVLPAASRARVGTAAFYDLLRDPALGLGVGAGTVNPLGSFDLAGQGDFDFVANAQLLDTFGGAGREGVLRARTAPAGGVRLRATVGAGWRLGVAEGPLAPLLFQLPQGEGASAALGRAALDVAVGRRFSASGVARVAVPVSDRQTLRVADAGQPYAPAYRYQTVERRLGREVQLEVTPRYALTQAFAVVAQAAVRDRGEARYAGQFSLTDAETGGLGPATFDASGLGAGTAARDVRAGFGLAYSTLAGYARGRSRLPVELSYLRLVPVSTSGGAVPSVTTDLLSVRVHAQLFGRGRAARPAPTR